MKQRISWVDYAKGIAIILVVYAHLLSSGLHAGLAIPENFFLLSDSTVYSFHMPLFFFLAGLFARQSLLKRGSWKFFVSKFRFIAYPYLLWSFLQGTVELMFSKQSHRGITVADLFTIPYLPLAQFWFLYAIFLMYAVYAFLSYLGKFAPVILLVLAWILFFNPISSEVMALHGFSTGFLFFILGLLIKEYFAYVERSSIPFSITLVLFCLLMGSTYTAFEYLIEPTRLTDGSHPFYFLFLACVGILFCIGLAQYLAKKKCCTVIKTFGIYSIQIYLVHMLAGVAVRIALLNFLSIENPVLHMIAGVSAGLFVPIALYKITMKAHFPYLFELKKIS
ncbi:MAG: acyltransferase [Thermodesulfobacteriota bacterium]|nr:acyltransferase [Thermodesulfobacteriota bacterium]